MPKTKKAKPLLTTAQQIGSLIKTARDIMRKDRGLSGDSDRLPQLTWIMFLKFLDDIESLRETEMELAGKKFIPAVEAPYRWRDWAADASGISGDALIAFINQDFCTRPDNSTGPGLFKYLRGLQGVAAGDRRDVIANVFRGTANRMVSGYLLRDVVNKVGGIHFNSSEELHLLGRTYETMLKEMRDAAGDAGEFYTPRPVVRFMVERLDPQLGETVLDPASGTGGFLVEAFAHLEKQAQTVKERAVLQAKSIRGGEAKPLPYLLTQMNLLLHGLENPQIDPGNALRFKVTEIGEADRVDVILTNPPFGGEEERGILGNFPEDRQTAETALLFLQLIMRRLRKKPTTPVKGEALASRAAVVVPNGTLFADGIAARIKADLLKDFNLHTIVRLPQGVFAPYTDIPANVLFFERGGPTQDIWFYELPPPEGRRKYSKTASLPHEAFADCTAWWSDRKEGPQAWRVSAESVIANGYNLDSKNPFVRERSHSLSLRELHARAKQQQVKISTLLDEIVALAEQKTVFWMRLADAPRRPLGEIAPLIRRPVSIDPEQTYTELGIKSFYKGAFRRRTVAGSEFTWQKMFAVKEGDLMFSNIMAWEQAIAVAGPEHAGCITNHRMLICDVDRTIADPSFLWFYFTTTQGFTGITAASPGTAARNKTLNPEALQAIPVPLPPLAQQQAFNQLQTKVAALVAEQAAQREQLEQLRKQALEQAFKGAA